MLVQDIVPWDIFARSAGEGAVLQMCPKLLDPPKSSPSMKWPQISVLKERKHGEYSLGLHSK